MASFTLTLRDMPNAAPSGIRMMVTSTVSDILNRSDSLRQGSGNHGPVAWPTYLDWLPAISVPIVQ